MDNINDNISLFSVLNLIITSLFNLVIIKLLILQFSYSLLLGLLGNTMYLIKNRSYNWGTQESSSSSDDSAKAHREDGTMHRHCRACSTAECTVTNIVIAPIVHTHRAAPCSSCLCSSAPHAPAPHSCSCSSHSCSCSLLLALVLPLLLLMLLALALPTPL